jgi:hypothetical protein
MKALKPGSFGHLECPGKKVVCLYTAIFLAVADPGRHRTMTTHVDRAYDRLVRINTHLESELMKFKDRTGDVDPLAFAHCLPTRSRSMLALY